MWTSFMEVRISSRVTKSGFGCTLFLMHNATEKERERATGNPVYIYLGGTTPENKFGMHDAQSP